MDSTAPFHNGDCSFVQFAYGARLFICFLACLVACLLVSLFSVRPFVSLFVRSRFLLGFRRSSVCLFGLVGCLVWLFC